jgi:hypothetical protein
MTWIRVDQPGPHNPRLAKAVALGRAGYPPEYSPEAQLQSRMPAAVANESIVMSHSLIPDALGHIFAGYAAMLSDELPLSRRQHELIAASVSALNRCFY